MIRIIAEYKKIIESLSYEIGNSPFKAEYIVGKSGMSTSTFYRKLRTKSFTPDEVFKVISIIKPQQAYNHKLDIILDECIKEVDEKKITSSLKVRNRISEKYKEHIHED